MKVVFIYLLCVVSDVWIYSFQIKEKLGKFYFIMLYVYELKIFLQKQKFSLISACEPMRWGVNCQHQCLCEHGTCNPRTGGCDCPTGWFGTRWNLQHCFLTFNLNFIWIKMWWCDVMMKINAEIFSLWANFSIYSSWISKMFLNWNRSYVLIYCKIKNFVIFREKYIELVCTKIQFFFES